MNSLRMLICAGFLTALPAVVYSQAETEPDPRVYVWLDGGIGQGSFGDNLAFELSVLNKLGLFSAKYNTLESPPTLSDDLGWNGTANSEMPSYHRFELTKMTELALLYGRAHREQFWFASASLGLSVLLLGSGYQTEASTVGLPFQAELFVTPLPILGFGVTFNSNVNDTKSFTSTVLCARFGLLQHQPPRAAK